MLLIFFQDEKWCNHIRHATSTKIVKVCRDFAKTLQIYKKTTNTRAGSFFNLLEDRGRDEARVDAVGREQLLVGALLDDLSVL